MSVKKNIAYSVSLNVLNVLFPVVTVPYVSRVLGVENIGLVNFLLTYVNYFGFFAALGIGFYGIREIAKFRDDQKQSSKIFSELFSINIISTLVTSLIFLVTLYTVPLLEADRNLLLIAGLSLYLAPLSIDWYFQGLEDFRIITLRSLIIKVLSIAGLFLFVNQRSDLVPYILLSVGSTVIANLWNLFYARVHSLEISFRRLSLKRHVKPVFVLFGSILAVSIFTMLDTLMLGFMSNYTEVGYYSSGVKLIRVIIPVFTAIGSVLLPKLAFNRQKNEHAANNELLQKSFDMTAFFISPAMIGLLLISPRFVPLFFGAEFLGAVLPMQILSALMIIVSLNLFFGVQILIGMERENLFLRAVAVAAVFNFFFNLILIPFFGASGAATGSILAEGVELVLCIYFVYKFTAVRIKWSGLTGSLCSSAPIIILYFVLDYLISDHMIFMFIFVLLSVISYISIQYFVAHNYLLDMAFEQIKNRIKK